MRIYDESLKKFTTQNICLNNITSGVRHHFPHLQCLRQSPAINICSHVKKAEFPPLQDKNRQKLITGTFWRQLFCIISHYTLNGCQRCMCKFFFSFFTAQLRLTFTWMLLFLGVTAAVAAAATFTQYYLAQNDSTKRH